MFTGPCIVFSGSCLVFPGPCLVLTGPCPMFSEPCLALYSPDHVLCSSDRVFCSVKMAEEVSTFTVLSVNTTEEKARKDIAAAEKQINFASNTDASTQGIYHL